MKMSNRYTIIMIDNNSRIINGATNLMCMRNYLFKNDLWDKFT